MSNEWLTIENPNKIQDIHKLNSNQYIVVFLFV